MEENVDCCSTEPLFVKPIWKRNKSTQMHSSQTINLSAILHKTPFIPFWFRKWEAWSLTSVKGSGACLSQKNAVDVGSLLTAGIKGLLFFSIFARFLPWPGKNCMPDWATVYKHWPNDGTGIQLKWNASNLFKANFMWISNQIIASQKKIIICFCLMIPMSR